MRDLIKKILKEAVGVPSDIEKASENLYNDLINEIRALDNSELEDIDLDNIKFMFINRDGRYSFSDFKPKQIFIKINIGFYDSTEYTDPMIIGMAHSNQAKIDDDLRIVSKLTDNVDLEISYVQPKTDNDVTTDKIINTLNNDKSEHISSLSHELKHAYDTIKKPEQTLKSRIKYGAYSGIRTNIRPLDEFMYNLYFIHDIENLVRPVEVYTDMIQNGVKTKQEFLDFFKNQKVLKTLKRISTYTFDELIDDLSKHESHIDDFLGVKLKLDIDGLDLEQKVLLTLEYFHKIIRNYLLSNYDNALIEKMSGMDRILSLVFGGGMALSERNKKLMSKLNNDASKFDNNPLDFYDYEMKKSKMVADKMIKKLSKLFSLLNNTKTIKNEIFDPKNFEMDQLLQKIKPRKSLK
jgi:hypothetical protein